jgi:hypothetical protein
MSKKLLPALLLALLLSGCSSGRFVGFMECGLDHSPVWWEYPNSQGSYDGIAVNAQNCNK